MAMTAVIITALPVEYGAVRAHLKEVQEDPHPKGNIYEIGKFTFKGHTCLVGLVQARKGNIRSAVQTERAIDHFQPSVVFFVGVAGGVKDVKLGDVVVGTKVYAYESGKDGLCFRMRLETANPAFRLIERAQVEARKDAWVHRIIEDQPIVSPQAYVRPHCSR